VAQSGFRGFSPEAIQFFRDLEKHNKRDWFQPRKEIFEAKVKAPMRELVGALNAAMQEFAPDHVSDPDKAIYRIYRDTRFSKDKTPYKDHIAAHFKPRGLASRGDAKPEGAGYYVAVSHKEVAVGGGIYMPSPPALLEIRNHIAERYEEFERLTGTRELKKLLSGELHGDRLSRPPKGFAADHPAAEALKYKSLFFYVELPPELAESKTLFGEVKKRFQALAPFVDYLNIPFQAKKKPKGRNFF
jgi:uncharacterized protein (TIGR02453 family)